MLGYPGGWTLYNYSKRKWECQCETDDQSRGEKVKKREKKSLCELWDTFKGNNLLLFVVLEEEVRWNGF